MPLIAMLGGSAVPAQPASAQQTAPAELSPVKAAPAKIAATKKPHSVSGSPLDTLRSTHLWTSTAPAKDFVTASRPDPKSLEYAPLTGADPERPRPRDAANVLALQAELEKAREVNAGKGRAVGGLSKKARKAVRP